MPRPQRIRSNPDNRPRGIRERREKAYRLFGRGFTNAEVARSVGVTPETSKRYRVEYENELREEATANPNLLRDVIKNTMSSLSALDDVRAEAWDMAQVDSTPPNVKASYLSIILKAEKERAAILGLLGAKTETAALFARIKEQQDKLIEYMRDHLCEEDRRQLEGFIMEQFASDLENVRDIADLVTT